MGWLIGIALIAFGGWCLVGIIESGVRRGVEQALRNHDAWLRDRDSDLPEYRHSWLLRSQARYAIRTSKVVLLMIRVHA